MSDRHVLIVTPDAPLANALRDVLQEQGFTVTLQTSPEHTLQLVEQLAPNLLVVEEAMEPIDGHALLAKLKAVRPDLPVVLITYVGAIEKAVQAMREGAADYLLRPLKIDQLLATCKRLLPNIEAGDDAFIAKDPYSRELLQLARKVAVTDVSVLISGESGTGKEVLARFVHANSLRHNKPFIAINCAAIPVNMLEAVLFGHEKGSFTGALNSNPGKFELAQGGTLLLDEISEMDLGLQAKLLRVLQEREVERIGGRKTIVLDVRVLATTNRNLIEEVRAGRFREDLFYRLNVFPLRLAPLRERPADVVALANHLIRRHSALGQRVPVLTAAASMRLEDYDWPGNIRELGNVVQRALVLCNGIHIDVNDLHFEAARDEPRALPVLDPDAPLNSDLRSHEYQIILKALQAGHGSRKYAAEKLGISPRTLRYKLARMREAGIPVPDA
ncbi:MAG: sigma-54-dependent transcriptional regulator [Thiotrichales bacterium]